MRTRTTLSLIACLIALIASAGPVHAGSIADLLKKVPAKAELVVAIDHTQWVKHPQYARLLKLLSKQKWGHAYDLASESGLAAGTNVTHSVFFRVPGGGPGLLVTGAVDEAKLASFAKAVDGGHELGKGLVASSLGGGLWLIAAPSLVAQFKEGLGKPITTRSGFKALKKEASKGSPGMWAVRWISEGQRKALKAQGATDMAAVERLTIQAKGKSGMTLTVVAHATTKAQAQAVVAGINGKIDRKIKANTMMRTLGVAALVESITLKAKGAAVVGSIPLTKAQVGLIARLGQKIIGSFR